MAFLAEPALAQLAYTLDMELCWRLGPKVETHPIVRVHAGSDNLACGDVPRFRADKSGWQFSFGWMADGLHGENAMQGRWLDVSLETPFVHWYIGYPTQLPDGRVVFQLGTNQICVLDPGARKVALLAKGRWPVVTIRGGRN